MDVLLRKRRTLKGKITRIQTAVDNQGDQSLPSKTIDKFHLQLEKLWTELNTVHDELGLLCEDDDDADTHQEEFDQLAARIEGLQAQLPSTSTPSTPSTPSVLGINSGTVNGTNTVRLPKLELPTFAGNLHEWTSFYDLFTASILQNKTLSNAQRLQYLKGSLRGEAASLIQSIQVTDDNFQPAWDILKNRFQNKRELVNSHLKRMCGFAPLSSEAPASSLRKLIDVTNETVRALRVLGVQVDHWDAILVHLISEKLDPDSRQHWELSLKTTEIAKYADFVSFLEQRARALITCSYPKARVGVKSAAPHNERRKPSPSTHHVNTAKELCRICRGAHPVFKCNRLLEASLEQRKVLVRNHSLCFNCFSSAHGWSQCQARNCRKCGRRHHTLLHEENAPTTSSPPEPEGESVIISHHSNNSTSVKEPFQVLLATALIEIQDVTGISFMCRALVDSGSQATFVTESCVARLGLPRQRSNVSVSGISSTPAVEPKGIVKLKVSDCIDSGFQSIVDAYVLKRVTGTLPTYECDPTNWDHLRTLKLADPNFHIPNSIDVLLGADVLAQVLREGLRRGPPDTPIAQESKLGWLVSGKCNSQNRVQQVITNLANVDLESSVQRFWEIESISQIKPRSKEENSCEDHFAKTHHRDSDGRFIVRLPFKETELILDYEDTRNIAVRRLKQIERRLESDVQLNSDYHNFLSEYQSLNHMKIMPPNPERPGSRVYLPHHAVKRDHNTTTRVRVVFDASAKCRTGMSLNDHLMVGPTLQDDLFSILVRFRSHLIALTADINKMYRQILVHEADTRYQNIVWRHSPQEPIRDYQLMTVTYGTASAPYLATKCLRQLAHENASDLPLAAAVTLQDFYVDDLMTGANTIEDAIDIQIQIRQLMARGCFELRKWCSNEGDVLAAVPPELRESSLTFHVDMDESIKTLGLIWSPGTDQFSFCLASQQPSLINSKRTVLSTLAKIFDPLGWLSPVTVKAKIIFQKLWRKPCGWDEAIPDDVNDDWIHYLQELTVLESIRINRCLFKKVAHEYQIHGFCDASENAYSAVVYLRTQYGDNQVEVSIISAKTKVAPIKPMTLPRLELCGAQLLAKLINALKAALRIPIQDTYAWSDSTIALAWIKACPSRWKTFVANRVADIQEMVAADKWRHVKGIENPADCASRGLNPTELQGHPLWWHGPPWLQESSYPADHEFNHPLESQAETEERIIIAGLAVVPHSMFTKYSSVATLSRVTAYLFRFVNNCRASTQDRLTGPLSSQEIDNAFLHWVKVAQSEQFPNEIKCLTSNKPISCQSRLLCLNPFLDAMGILRVGGRLRHANVNVERKFPILLPTTHALTTLIVQREHIRQLHAGPQLLLATLQQRFWIVNGRNVVRQCVHRCVTCCRQRAQVQQPKMGDLPAARVTSARPFEKCGVDYAGPIILRALKLRGKTTYKAYIAIFVCFTTHAVHLELVSDLSTDAFIAALKRFVSRRGKCSDIYSDCGTNFVGANKELQLFLRLTRNQTHNEKIAHYFSDTGTTWHFNPPASPHFGGLWEAGVKSVKFHLKRVVGDARLTFEEMYTILTQVEACLNSRPLCPLSSDPNDLNALTPGHFLIGAPLTAIPEPDYRALKTSHLSRWQLIQQMLQHFWRRWQQEYLSKLQQRPKSWTKSAQINVNDLVLIKDERLPPSKWLLGRILATHPGVDGIVRVATIKTASGQFKRPVVKICKLPIDD